MSKKEQECEIYYITCWTFRRTLELRIGGSQPMDIEEKLSYWLYRYDVRKNCNVIWLEDYYANVLVHELFHCVEQMCAQVDLEFEWEQWAFMMEELLIKCMIEVGKKNKTFRLNDMEENFYMGIKE